jgi:phosphopantetheinyl transferase (holo-ACP synthase)
MAERLTDGTGGGRVVSGIVGNDIIDLGDVGNAGAHARPRLVSRVCCDAERERVMVSSDPLTLFWSLFAAKEAAFKLTCKVGVRPVFAHRLFVVDASLTSVSHDGRTFHLRIERVGDRLHAVAWTGGEPPIALATEADAAIAPGIAVRHLATTSLANLLGCTSGALTIAREPEPLAWDDLGPPRLLLAGLPLDLDLSLSHDGRFVGFAASRPF